MAGKNGFCVKIILIYIFLCFSHVKSSKLNVPRVLLPIFNDFSTNFTLEVTEGGCYKWTTSRLDLVQLIPLDVNEQDCSSRVVVSTISKEPTRNTAIVLAEDIYTDEVLRCDVIVDVIASLNIMTTTRELFMEEAPEAFEIKAFDEQGNAFTTLEGIQFDWSLSGTTGSSVLRFITFRDSPYETPVSVQAFDEVGKQGHIILLEGVKTGSAKVSCRIPHPEYKHLNGIDVSLMVIANLIIEPADVYILLGDVVHYKIIQVKHGRLEEIKLPGQYYLVSEKSSIAFIEKNSGYLTGMNLGKTRVYLHDKNVNNNDSGLKLPSAVVYVVEPARISLNLLPHRNWAVLQRENHDIVAELFASNDHKIHLGDDVQFQISIDTKYFGLSSRSMNGSFVSGTSLMEGTTEVTAEVSSVKSAKLGTVRFDEKLLAKAEMLIFPQIHLIPGEIFLPWDPIVKPRYEIELKATGGDGKFLWSTSNHSIGVVTQKGLVRTAYHGKFDTCVSMLRNHHNKECARFNIIPPSKLEVVQFIMEAEVGVPIFIHLALYATKPIPGGTSFEMPFTKCRELSFDVVSSENNFYYDGSATTEPIGVSCTNVAVIGVTSGISRIKISYTSHDIHLEETVTVSCYRPLNLINPSIGYTVLALATSRHLIFNGGPRAWPGRPSEHFVQVESSNPKVVEAVDVTKLYKVPGESDTYVVKVICKELGEAQIQLKVFNKPLIPNCKYQESISVANVICAVPVGVSLQPEIKVANVKNCPMDLSSEKVIVPSYSNIDLLVIVRDHLGRKFDNITSLQFKWDLNPTDMGQIVYSDSVYEHINLEHNVLLPNKSYQVIKPERKTGIVDVQATIVDYHQTLKLKNINKFNRTSYVLTLFLVDDTDITPNKLSIYNHPFNKQKLLVQQGSGYNGLRLSSDEIANVQYLQMSREIEITPKRNGKVHISVQDLCLDSLAVVVEVNVVSVAAIKIEVPSWVEMGKCIPGIVKFLDENENLMPLPKLEYLDIKLVQDNQILNLKIAEERPENPWDVGEVHYIITGLELGETKLVASAGHGKTKIVSLQASIQVFSAIKIHPRNATLMVGSVLQLTTHGGPQPDSNMDYSLDNQGIAEINSHGIFHALAIGHTRVTARSLGVSPITGQRVINSEDTVDITIIPLAGIKLSSPLIRFVSGTVIPIWVTGLPDKLSPLILGSVEPPLLYSWAARCSDVIELYGLFHPMGIKDNPQNKISVRAKGLKPGECTIEVNVTVPGVVVGIKNKDIKLTASLDMEVVERFQLHSPQDQTGQSILIAPFSRIKLRTNQDGSSNLKYSVRGEEISDIHNHSVSLSTGTGSIIAVNSNGVIESFGVIGRAMIVINAIDEYGLKQTLTVVVQVKPVHYMLLSASSTWLVSSEENINVIPVGSHYKLSVSYHDNTGVEFNAASCNIHYYISRSDLMHLKRTEDGSNILKGQSNHDGSSVLKVWSEDCFKTADYVHLFSGQVALPHTNSLTAGDIICMWSPVTDLSRQQGDWSGEPFEQIHLDNLSGIGQVTTRDTSHQIHIKYGHTPAAKISLDVEPISQISFLVGKTKLAVTNSPQHTNKIPLVFQDAKHPAKKSNLHAGWQCERSIEKSLTSFPFKCSVEFVQKDHSLHIGDVFQAQPSFDIDTGLYACELVPTSDITTNSSIIESNIYVTAYTLNDVTTGPFEIQFVPAIFISSQELIITESALSATLILTGLRNVLDQVIITPNDEALLNVANPIRISKHSDNYEVTLLDYHWKLEQMKDPMSIVVYSSLTNQNVHIQVKVTGEKLSAPFCSARQTGSPLGNLIYDNKQTFIIILSMLTIFFVTFYAYSHYIQPVINVNVAPGGSRNGYIASHLQQSTPLQNYHDSAGDRSTLLNTSSSFSCSPQNNFSHLNTTSPTMRLGSGNLTGDSRNISMELRRNRRFL